jgi:hypothetical protein
MKNIASRFAPVVGAIGLSLALAAPVAAQPVVTGGLVNVTIVDFADVNLEDIVVQLPVSVAANVCGVSVEVLVADLAPDGIADCDARSASRANR